MFLSAGENPRESQHSIFLLEQSFSELFQFCCSAHQSIMGACTIEVCLALFICTCMNLLNQKRRHVLSLVKLCVAQVVLKCNVLKKLESSSWQDSGLQVSLEKFSGNGTIFIVWTCFLAFLFCWQCVAIIGYKQQHLHDCFRIPE